MNPKPERAPSLLDRLAPMLHQAATAEERRLLLAAALAEHRRQGTPLFATRSTGSGTPRGWRQGLTQGLSLGLARAAAQGAASATQQTLQPIAQQHPFLLLGAAGAAGMLLALSRPQRLVRWGWRWVRPVLGVELSAAVHGYLRQGLRRALVGAVRQGLAPSADRPAPGPGLS